MSDGFNAFLEEILVNWHPITIRRMFGGEGVFREGIMFGLIADDELYFKTDSKTKKVFEDMNCPQFLYKKKDKIIHMNFFKAPEECYDCAEKMEYYADMAWQTALKAQKPT